MNTIKTYKEWVSSVPYKITTNISYDEYLKYINSTHNLLLSSKSNILNYKVEYLAFLDQIKKLFTGSEYENLIKYVDVNNDAELRLAIPFFASQLSSISQDISKKRLDPNNTTKRYADLDSMAGVKRAIYNKIATKYANEHSIDIHDVVNSEIKDIYVTLTEYYDTSMYMDKDPSVNVSEYFDTAADAIAYEPICDQEVPKELLEWIIKSGFSDVSTETGADFSEVRDGIDYGSTQIAKSDYKKLLSEKYLAEDQFIINTSTLNADKVIDVTNTHFNGIARYFPTVATMPSLNNITNSNNIGLHNLPANISVPVWHGKNRQLITPNTNYKRETSPDPIRYSPGNSTSKTRQTGQIPYNPTYNWVVSQFNRRGNSSIIGDTDGYQEMVPYKSSYELYGNKELGISKLYENADPWSGPDDTDWDDPISFPPDFRIIYDIEEWKNQIRFALEGHEYSWGIDLHGINYALYKPKAPLNEFEFKNAGGGEIFVRGVDGYILPFVYFIDNLLLIKWAEPDKTWDDGSFWTENDEAASYESYNVFENVDISDLKEMQIYDNVLFIVDRLGHATIQELGQDDNGIPIIDPNNGFDLHYDLDGEKLEYEYLDHFYDTAQGALYVAMGIVEEYKLKIKIFSWKNTKIERVVDIIPDELEDILSIKSANISIHEDTRSLGMVFKLELKNGSREWVIFNVNLDTNLTNDEIISIPLGSEIYGTTTSDEERRIINLDYIHNCLIFTLEGAKTNNKYLHKLNL